MPYEPLHHKYRPQMFSELVGQEAIATTLSNALEQKRIAPAYLFSGPRGTGKTSSARILAKSLNCLNSANPTPAPCGECEVCRAIANGSALDVIEIDAASNTGVDNIRELIERSQFAPVQCRYKVYVIDECLTGDTLVTTRQGLMRLEDSQLKGKQVLSFAEQTGQWEYKKVLRWLDQGTKPTLTIKTNNREIRCTDNHLIRTTTGWVQAKNVVAGTKILSPANMETAGKFREFRTTSNLVQTQRDAGLATIESSPSPQWTTNFETIESVTWGKAEPVYDIEVEDNHNFVANGLLVHNCHMLSVAAFNALLKTLEEPPAHVVFVLATTDPQRVLPTIISRCQRFDYRRIPLDAMVSHLRKIARNENIDIPLESVTLVAQIANGGLRDAESLLDQLSLLSGEITPDKVWDLVGAVPERDLLGLIQVIRSNHPESVIQQCRNLLNRGREPLVVLQNLASFYLNLLIAKTAPERGDLIAVTQPTWQALCQEAKGWELPIILKGQQHLKDSEYQLKNTTQPRLWLEITLLGLLPSALASSAVQTETIATPPVFVPAQVAPAPTLVAAPPQETVNHPFGETQSFPAPQPVAPAPMPQPAPMAENSFLVSAENGRSPQTFPPASTPESNVANGQVNNPDPVETPAPQSPTPAPQSQPVIEPVQAAPQELETQPQPTPAPASETVEAPSTSPTISALEREQLWETMLAQLQPLTTQQLLRQQGCLVSFNGAMAVIGIKSQPLLGIAKNKQENIEAAFQKASQKQVRISFQVGHEPTGDVDLFAPSAVTPEPPTAIANSTPTAPEPPVRSLPIEPVPVATPFDAPENLPDAPAPIPSPQPVQERPPLRVVPKTVPPAIQPSVNPQPQNGQTNGHNGSVSQPLPIAPKNDETFQPQETLIEPTQESFESETTEENDGDRLRHLTQEFAEFFSGEVIKLTHLALPETEDAVVLETVPEAKPEPPQVQNRPPVTTSPEDDIPF